MFGLSWLPRYPRSRFEYEVTRIVGWDLHLEMRCQRARLASTCSQVFGLLLCQDNKPRGHFPREQRRDQVVHRGLHKAHLAILVPWTTVSRIFGPLVRVTLDHGFAQPWTTCYSIFGPGSLSPFPSFRWLLCLRMDSSLISTGIALWTMRSMMASATVRSPRLSYCVFLLTLPPILAETCHLLSLKSATP